VGVRGGDGNGWVRCAIGHHHWGLFGAAGLLVVAEGTVLLQHRAPWGHEGDTWGIPGGARDSHEGALEAALREAYEETGLDPALVTVEREVVDDHGGWSYTTVVGTAERPVAVHPLDGESVALEWVPLREVADLRLHPGFAVGWPVHLRDLLAG
jgi:8-oxo-dGTP diphosphatase